MLLFGLLNEILLTTSKHVETDRQQSLEARDDKADCHLHLLGRSLLALALGALGLALDWGGDGRMLVLAGHDERHVVDLVREHEVLLLLLEQLHATVK